MAAAALDEGGKQKRSKNLKNIVFKLHAVSNQGYSIKKLIPKSLPS